MSKKRRIKKHNPNKRAQRFFSRMMLWTWESEAEGEQQIAYGQNWMGAFWRDLQQREIQEVMRRNNNWVVICRALCRVDDHVWVESEARSARDTKVSDFEGMFSEMRTGIFQKVKLAHVYDFGWIISSFGKTDRIDDNLEMKYLGEPTKLRRELWLGGRAIHEAKATKAA